MHRDDAYLLDILIAARRAQRFLANLTWEEFAGSELHQDAVIRPLAIIGEAARQISHTAIFAGAVLGDTKEFKRLPFFLRFIAGAMARDTKDHRDWDAIRAWAEGLRPLLVGE